MLASSLSWTGDGDGNSSGDGMSDGRAHADSSSCRSAVVAHAEGGRRGREA